MDHPVPENISASQEDFEDFHYLKGGYKKRRNTGDAEKSLRTFLVDVFCVFGPIDILKSRIREK